MEIRNRKGGNMTNQESLDLLALFARKYVSQEDDDDLFEVPRECRDKLQELVDRATPMKIRVITNIGGYLVPLCPKCDEEVENAFCGICGQELDWSEDE